MTTSQTHIADICKQPRGYSIRGALFLSVFNLALIALTACGPTASTDGETCEPLACTLACPNGFVTDDDGCDTCACLEGPIVGDGCYSDSDCGDNVCNLSACLPAPGCEEGEACDAVCYGVCEEPLQICNDTAACAAGKICRDFGGPGHFTTGPQADEAQCDANDPDCNLGEPTDPGGVCVPDSCGEGTVLLPNCPEGTQLALDFTQDPCGEAICVDTNINECRDLDPNICESVPGCRLEEVEAPCQCDDDVAGETDECVCPDVIDLICVAEEEGCANLDEQACLSSDLCFPEYYNHGGCAEPAPCEPGNGDDCDTDADIAPCFEELDFICLPFDPTDECYSDYDCGPGRYCDAPQACSVVCYDAEDGTSDCFEECWQEPGRCVGGGQSCYDLSPEECYENPGCELQDDFINEPCGCAPGEDCDCGGEDQLWAPICVPSAPPTCGNGEECPYGYHCEEDVVCPECNPDDPNDLDCFAACHVEGQCVPGMPPPPSCDDNIDCGPNHACETVTVCESSCYADDEPTDPNGGNQAPPFPCEDNCYEEAICVYVGGGEECWEDWDCGPNAYCSFENDDCWGDDADPDFGIAQCPGTCIEIEPPDDLCWNDGDCNDGSYCNFDNCGVPGDPNDPDFLIACLGVCEPDTHNDECNSLDETCGPDQFCAYDYCEDGGPDDMEGVCYGRCYDNEPNPNDVCLDDGDCGDGYRCATELDVCACPEGDEYCWLNGECYSLCVPVQPQGDCYDDGDCIGPDGTQGWCAYTPDQCNPMDDFCGGICQYDLPNQCEFEGDYCETADGIGGICFDGVCHTNPDQCQVEGDLCTTGSGQEGQCNDGQCIPFDAACQVDNDCDGPPGLIVECINGQCVYQEECNEDSQCNFDETCNDGQCEPAACTDVITPAVDLDTGECVEFPNGCIPNGFVSVSECPDQSQGCGGAEIPATNGQVCIVFRDTCIPPEFEPVGSCDGMPDPGN